MRTTRANVVAGALSAVGFLLYLAPATRDSLWNDEGVSSMTARGSWHDLWHTLRTFDPNMSLYDVVLRGWQLGGTGEAWQRSLSALCLGTTVFVIYLVGSRLRDAAVGLWAAAFLAVSPLAVRYGHEVRSYALLTLLVAVATLLLVHLVDAPSPATAVACGVVAALAAYAHAYGLLAALALAISLPLLGPDRPPMRVLVIAGFAYAVAVAPFLLLVVTGPDPLIHWISTPTVDSIRGAAATLAGNNALLVVVGVMTVVAAVVAIRSLRAGGRARATWALGMPVLALIVPPVVALLWSFTVQPILVGRYLIVSLPALALVVGTVLALVPWRVAQVALFGVLLIGSLVSVRKFLDEPSPQDWRAAVRHVVDHAQPGDGVVFCSPASRPAFEHYVLRTPGARALTPLSPSEPWGDGAHTDSASAEEVAEFGDTSRIWVVEHSDGNPNSSPACDLPRSMSGRTAADSEGVGHVKVTRYDS